MVGLGVQRGGLPAFWGWSGSEWALHPEEAGVGVCTRQCGYLSDPSAGAPERQVAPHPHALGSLLPHISPILSAL